MRRLSRRDFVRISATGAAAAASPFVLQAATLTAQDVVDRIRKSVGGDWQAATVDAF